MKWATEALIHFDRVISAWLILRFIDDEAEFTFLVRGEQPPEGAIVFGVPNAALGAHDGDSTTFQRILEAYSLTDAGLGKLGRLVADVVGHVMQDPNCALLPARHAWTGGALGLAEGVMLLSANDAECLQRSLGIYDAMFARLQAETEMQNTQPNLSLSVIEQTLRFAGGVRELRRRREKFSPEAFHASLSGAGENGGGQPPGGKRVRTGS